MNEFGRMAMDHWRVARPISFERIPESEREAFFQNLGGRPSGSWRARGSPWPGTTYHRRARSRRRVG